MFFCLNYYFLCKQKERRKKKIDMQLTHNEKKNTKDASTGKTIYNEEKRKDNVFLI